MQPIHYYIITTISLIMMLLTTNKRGLIYNIITIVCAFIGIITMVTFQQIK
jgi:hypothetical protein